MSEDPTANKLASRDPRFWKYKVEQWMWDAAYTIDSEVGLTHFDLAISATAHMIARSYTLAKEAEAQGQGPPPQR